MTASPQLFALDASQEFGRHVARALGLELSEYEMREFEDGEHKSRPLVTVRDRDVYVIQSLHGRGGPSVNDKLIRLLIFIGALKQSGAARVTAVVPYLCYARKDRRTKPNDPVTTRYVAALFEAVGTDAVMSLDVHNSAAFENAFRCAAENLEARHVLAAPVAEAVGDEEIVVLSPDAGGVKRAERFRESLEGELGRPAANGFMEKRRSGGEVTGEQLVAEVEGKTVVIVDDLIAGGTTLSRAAEACRRHGARRIIAAATHGIFAPGAEERLAASPLERLFIGDTIPQDSLSESFLGQRVTVVGLSPFVAEAIRRLYHGESLAAMSQVYGY
jgi:ribose-phosphate pyrophosphokinase